MPIWLAVRTVIRLRDCSTPQRMVCCPALAPEKLRKHFCPSLADWKTQKGPSITIDAGVMPLSSAAAYTNGLKVDPGCRCAWVARLNEEPRESKPPCIANICPV